MRISPWCLTFSLLCGSMVVATAFAALEPEINGVGLDAGAQAGVIDDGGSTAGNDPCGNAQQFGEFDIPSTFANRFRGNMITVIGSAQLQQFALELNFQSPPTQLTFWVLGRDPSPEHVGFVPLAEQSLSAPGVGQAYYWSPPFNPPIVLNGGVDGAEFVLGVSWGSINISYGRDSETYPQPFSGGFVEGLVGLIGEPFPHVELSPFTGGAYSMRACFAPRPGKCCQPGSCTTVLESACNGFFEGEGTTCVNSPCVFGACCRLTGECEDDLTFNACFAPPGGFWNEETACADLEPEGCPVVAGACCFGNVCADAVLEGECPGSYRGNGSHCNELDLPCGVGACCSLMFGCFEAPASTCMGLGGEGFQGDGTHCITLSTPCGGACCAGPSHNMCLASRDPIECNQIPGGVFAGYPNMCTAGTCADAGNSGACCMPNGDCAITTQLACEGDSTNPDVPSLRGMWSAGVTCAAAMCPGVGACCLELGECLMVTTEACNGIEGATPHGGPCTPDECEGPPAPGACCSPNGNCMDELSSSGCAQLGGIFQGGNTSCDDVECPQPPTGACCVAASGACSVELEDDCDGPGETYMGDNTDCDDVDCPQPATGACCFEATGMCQMLTQSACGSAPGGDYQGDNMSCEEADCPLPAAACCLPNGDCTVLTPALCAGQNGMYQGPQSACGTVDCIATEMGACCLPDEMCMDNQTMSACIGLSGTYQGVGTTCMPGICAQPQLGACCLPNGMCENNQTLNGCTAAEGMFQGVGIVCGVDPCPLTGACCLNTGDCIVVTEFACAGDYMDDGSACDPDPCPDVPLAIVSAVPPDNAIDARQPSTLAMNCADLPGFTSVELTFSGDTSALVPSDFIVTTSAPPPFPVPGDMVPSVVTVDTSGVTATLTLSTRVPVGVWTIITHTASGSSTRVGNLPGDVNNDRTVSPFDVLQLIDHLNMVQMYEEHQTDIDRSGVTGPADILRVIDLLNGAGCYAVYNGLTLPP